MALSKSTSWAPTSIVASPASEDGVTRRPDSEIPSLGLTLSIIVGKKLSTRTFHMHENLAVKLSDFLAAAVRNGWKESAERTVKLPEEDPELFRIFEAFTYSGRIYSKKEGDTAEGNGYRFDREYVRIEQLWLLGERLQASEFKDAIVDVLIEKMRCEREHPTGAYKRIYTNSVALSPMKKLLVDIALWRWNADSIARIQIKEEWSDFVKDLVIEQHKYLEKGRPKMAPFERGPSCIYHEHSESKACYKTMFK